MSVKKIVHPLLVNWSAIVDKLTTSWGSVLLFFVLIFVGVNAAAFFLSRDSDAGTGSSGSDSRRRRVSDWLDAPLKSSSISTLRSKYSRNSPSLGTIKED